LTYIFNVFFYVKVKDLQLTHLVCVYFANYCVITWWWPDFRVETSCHINKTTYKCVGCNNITSGTPEFLNYCKIFAACTQFTNVGLGSIIQPSGPQVGNPCCRMWKGKANILKW